MTASRRSVRFSAPPRPLRRSGTALDNVALVPASMLPFKEEWQRVANDLPKGDTLLVVPHADTPLRQSMQRVAAQLHARGRHVVAVDAEQLAGTLRRQR